MLRTKNLEGYKVCLITLLINRAVIYHNSNSYKSGEKTFNSLNFKSK